MSDNEIEGLDVCGDLWRLRVSPDPQVCVAFEAFKGEPRATALLTKADAIRAANFLLAAAGVDIVGAAKKVKEAREEVERYNRGGSTSQYIGAAGDLCEEVDALSAELVKMDLKGSNA